MIRIIKSNFNQKVVDGLLDGCLLALKEKNIKDENINISEVPGAFEIPFTIKNILSNDNSKKLVTLMHVNNEIGKILDLKKVSSICKKHSTYFHTDAVQSIGHFRFDLDALDIDFLSAL